MAHAFIVAGCLLLAADVDQLSVLPEQVNNVPRQEMVYEHLRGLAEKALQRRLKVVNNLKTAEQVRAYQQSRKQFFLEKIGTFPKRTPLNAKVTGKVERDDYVVERVIFESRPKHYVTALMYLPKKEPPFPGVLVPCGHSVNGKLYGAYQAACILLVKHGHAVLCFDPIEQGERYQLFKPEGDIHGTPVMNHCLLGLGSTLVGRDAAHYEIWDGMRAIDYLQSRPEVDAERIGCTGNSGGGNQTGYLMALDDRIDCAAPSCFLTNFHWLLDTFGPPDAEQHIHGQLAFGMDHPDYVIMRAPKPTRMLVATKDNCAGIDGARDCYQQAKQIYGLLGKPERLTIVEADAPHGFSRTLRVGAVDWMQRWLLKRDEPVVEPNLGRFYLRPEEGTCTDEGQVMRITGARSTYAFNIDLENQLRQQRRKLWQTTDRAKLLETVRRVADISELSDLSEPEVQNTDRVERDDCRIEKLIFKVADDLWLPALMFVPPELKGPSCLFVCDYGKHHFHGKNSLIGQRVKAGQLVLAVDLPDLGETKTRGDNKTLRRGYLPMLLGRSFLALRADEILRAARWLAKHGPSAVEQPVELVAVGYEVGPPALHATVLEPQLFVSTSLDRSPLTWTDMVTTQLPFGHYRINTWYVNLVHGALKTYDLADLIGCLPNDKLTVSNPVDCWNRPPKEAQKK